MQQVQYTQTPQRPNPRRMGTGLSLFADHMKAGQVLGSYIKDFFDIESKEEKENRKVYMDFLSKPNPTTEDFAKIILRDPQLGPVMANMKMSFQEHGLDMEATQLKIKEYKKKAKVEDEAKFNKTMANKEITSYFKNGNPQHLQVALSLSPDSVLKYVGARVGVNRLADSELNRLEKVSEFIGTNVTKMARVPETERLGIFTRTYESLKNNRNLPSDTAKEYFEQMQSYLNDPQTGVFASDERVQELLNGLASADDDLMTARTNKLRMEVENLAKKGPMDALKFLHKSALLKGDEAGMREAAGYEEQMRKMQGVKGSGQADTGHPLSPDNIADEIASLGTSSSASTEAVGEATAVDITGQTNTPTEVLPEGQLPVPEGDVKVGPIEKGPSEPFDESAEKGLERRLRSAEGEHESIYNDSRGNLTMGIGHRITKEDPEYGKPEGTPISDERREELFKTDMDRALSEARRVVPNYEALPPKAKSIVTEMAFQMGGKGLAGFKKFGEALSRGDYETASEEMLRSYWAKQTPKRARRLASEMKRIGKRVAQR